MLEDDFTWVLRKALAGHGWAAGEAAARAGISQEEFNQFLRGVFSDGTARKIAPVLGLGADAFATLVEYEPAPVEISGIRRVDLSFGKERVNAWLISKDEETLLFDLGHDREELPRFLLENGVTPGHAFITHAHHDHTAALEHVISADIPVSGAKVCGASCMKPGDVRRAGPFSVTAIDLSGHADPALGYQIEGLGKPVLVIGDALFAGSMGGCSDPARYRHALERLHAELDPLPAETIILPGHGPATTLGEERARNPFLAGN